MIPELQIQFTISRRDTKRSSRGMAGWNHCATVLFLQYSASKVSYNIAVAGMFHTNQKLK